MTLQTALPRFLHLIGESLLKAPLSRQMSAFQRERAQLLATLNLFENEVLRLRFLYKKGELALWTVEPSLREWVTFSDAHYFKSMAARYRVRRFDADADRVEGMSKHGQKKTKEVFGEDGNLTGTETVTDGKDAISNAIELQL
jgi:hypothetical protein